MSGYTKGPWTLQDCPHGGAILKRGVDVREHPQSHLQIVPVEDARLMAAAPDLLAALHLAAEALDAYSDVNDGDDGPTPNRAMSALQEIGEVILKAEGQPR